MAVPKYNEFFPSILNCLSDGNIHTLKNIREYCISAFSLSENDQKEQLEKLLNDSAIEFGEKVGSAKAE